jgi:hypothetical protein
VGDFNGDGRPDLVAANQDDGNVAVLVDTTPAGASTASFAAAQTFVVGDPVGVAVADFNGDGRPDLVVTDNANNAVSVLLNTTPIGSSTLSFAARQSFGAGSSPEGVVAGDLNGDGRPDLAVADLNTNTVSVLLNTTPAGASTPSFAAPRTFAVGNFPRNLAVGDFNGDGRPDLAVANFNGGSVSVLFNNTAAGASVPFFAAQQTFAVGTNPQSVAVGDFDGDGRPDLVVTNSIDNQVGVLVNTTAAGASAPSFAAQQTFAVGDLPEGVAVAYFNQDGRADLVVANASDNSASVLLNTTMPFTSTQPVLVGQFGTQGVWEINRMTRSWVQLTPSNATLLAADPLGDVVGEFRGYGLQLYRPAVGWRQINGVDASALAMDARGNIVASFPGYGVGEFLLASGWRILTPSVATLLAMDANGDVAGEFPGYGIQLFRPATGWQQINGVDATLLAMDANGDIAANFPGYGVAKFQQSTGWRIVDGIQSTALTIDVYGNVIATFIGYGVGKLYTGGGGSLVTAASAAFLVADSQGGVYGEFVGYGVWKYDPTSGWIQVYSADATFLASS